MFKNTAGQRWVVFAFEDEGGTNPGEPVTGDAANITANLRLDGGAANAVDDLNPAELEDGYYYFDITQAESNADMILIAPASSTANVNVIGVPGVVYTTTDVSGVEAKIDTIDGIVDAVLVDTDTTIPALIAALNDVSAADVNAQCDAAISDAALATAANLATVDTVVDAIKVVTDNIAGSASTIVDAACTATTLGNTAFSTNLTQTTDDHYKGRIVTFTSGNLKDQSTDITAYNGTTKVLTVSAMTEAPADTDTFTIT